MKIILIGFACCYKTSSGEILAKKLNFSHIDIDKAIERATGNTVAEIFAAQGEKQFRKLERDALIASARLDNVVTSCGGGSVLCPDFDALWDDASVVWLTASPKTIYSRLGGNPRPLFDGRSINEIAESLNLRVPYYSRYADVTVATDNFTSEQVADAVCKLLKLKM